MDYPNNTTESRKNKHLSLEERIIIQVRLKDGFTPCKISKELGRTINTIIHEIKRGTTTQIISNKKIEVYPAAKGQAVYQNNRKNSYRPFKRLE